MQDENKKWDEREQRMVTTLHSTPLYLRQNIGMKIRMTVNISNRPMSMQKLRYHLAKSGMAAQVKAGPALPKAGPVLPKADIATPIEVSNVSPIHCRTKMLNTTNIR